MSLPDAVATEQRGIALPRRRALPQPVWIGLWLMALTGLITGLQQQFTPRWFYDEFPGFGMHWVSGDGPFNEHLLRDLGGANLALAMVIFLVMARPTAFMVRAVAVAFLVPQASHFVYHLLHLNTLATSLDRVLQTTLLTATILVPILVLIAARDMPNANSS